MLLVSQPPAWWPDEALNLVFDPDVFRTFSASLPAVLDLRARPWNGRALTDEERAGALREAAKELTRGGTQWYAAQAAHEWLSLEAW